MKSQPWSAVVGIDDAAADESELEQDVLHYVVVDVGVGPKVKAMGSSPTEAFQSHASLNARRCQTVDGSIWARIEPSALFDYGIGGVVSNDEAERGKQAAVAPAHT